MSHHFGYHCRRYSSMRYIEFSRAVTPSMTSQLRRPDAEGISAVDYMKSMRPFFTPQLPFILPSPFESIQSVEFYGFMLVDNFLQILTHCPNMTDLTFTQVKLDDYQRWNPERYELGASTRLAASNLGFLEFNGTEGLSKSELLLLDMLCNWVDMPELDTLSFNTMNYGYQAQDFPNVVMDNFGEAVPGTTLKSLLIKCRDTLDNLHVRRHNFTLIPSNTCTAISASQDQASSLHTVELRKLRSQYDAIGLPELLRSQRRLEKIDCSASHTNSRLLNKQEFAELYVALGEAVLKSSRTLKQLHFVSLAALQPEEENESDAEDGDTEKAPEPDTQPIVVDFGNFENCTNLTGIWLSKMSHQRIDGMNVFSPNFTFINAHHLPTSLVQFELATGFVNPEELLHLTRRLPALVHLQYCRINSLQEFAISKECFTNIVSMQHSWIQILLFNGVFAQDFYPQQVLMEHNNNNINNNNAPNGRNWEVRFSDGALEFVCKEDRPRLRILDPFDPFDFLNH